MHAAEISRMLRYNAFDVSKRPPHAADRAAAVGQGVSNSGGKPPRLQPPDSHASSWFLPRIRSRRSPTDTARKATRIQSAYVGGDSCSAPCYSEFRTTTSTTSPTAAPLDDSSDRTRTRECPCSGGARRPRSGHARPAASQVSLTPSGKFRRKSGPRRSAVGWRLDLQKEVQGPEQDAP